MSNARSAVLAGILAAEPLVSVAWDGRPVFRLAESASQSADGRQLTFKLRPNVRFHTGQIATAGQIRDLLLPKLLRTTEVAQVTAPDDRTLVIVLKRAHSLKTVDLSDFIVDDDRRPELRTGPFRITALKPTAELEPFPQYYLGRPSVRALEIREYPNHRAAWTAMMRGEINVLHEINRDAINFTLAGGDIRAYPVLRPYYVTLVFNQAHPVLQHRDVRVAINEAINREAVVKNGMRGHGEIAQGPIWPHHWAHPHVTAIPYNPETAKLRLDAAGLPVRQRTGQSMPFRFSFTCMLRQGDTRFERIALVIQRELFEIGVDMRLESFADAEFFDRLVKGRFDAFLFEMMSGRTLSSAYNFWRSPTPGSRVRLPSGYSAADAALDRMKYAASDEELRVAVADVMRVMRTDPPAVFLAWPREARAASAEFEIPYEQDQDIFGSLWQATRAAENEVSP